MATPDIDTNVWYSLYIASDPNSLLMSTNLFSRDGTAGAAFFATRAADNATQRWQIFPVSTQPPSFVLRTQEGGANAFIGSQPADVNGLISPLMWRGDVADDSVFWTMGAWGDGTWWFANQGNGTGFHLARNHTGVGVFMDGNVTAPQNAQRWGVEMGARIDDAAYSSVNLLGVTRTAMTTIGSETPVTKSESATSSSSPTDKVSVSTSASTNSSTGLSTPAKAGLGAALGIAALIALVVLGLFLRRRHRAQKRIETTMTKDVAFEPNQFAPSLPERRQEFAKYELDHGSGSAKFEMPHQAVVEVDARGQERPAELMGDVERRRG